MSSPSIVGYTYIPVLHFVSQRVGQIATVGGLIHGGFASEFWVYKHKLLRPEIEGQ